MVLAKYDLASTAERSDSVDVRLEDALRDLVSTLSNLDAHMKNDTVLSFNQY